MDNISDLASVVAKDSLAFLRIERDFGSFDLWQDDFVACALGSRSGWAILAYSIPLKRYMNISMDGNSAGMTASTIPMICLNMHEYAYFRDYLNKKKDYVFAMMKELKWDVIENRIKKIEKIINILR